MHVLHVDDSPEDLALVKKAFEAVEGPVRVTSILDSMQLLPLLRRYGAGTDRPDVILLDLGMPKVSGKELLVALKDDPNLRSIPVMILSGRAVETNDLLGGEAPAHSFVTKADDYEQLKKKVASIHRYLSRTVRLPDHGG